MNKVTLAIIAEKAGVSKSTVSIALRNDPRILKSSRLRIQKIARELGYHSNPVVSQLMAELRKSQSTKYLATLACVQVSCFDPKLMNLAMKEWKQGFSERAHSQGYEVDDFWLHEVSGGAQQNAERISRILKARSIRGIVFYDVRSKDDLRECEVLWGNFPSVVIGPKLEQPALNFVTSDQFGTAQEACKNILAAGYQRIGIVLDHRLDGIMEHKITGGYQFYRSNCPDWPPLLYLPEEPEKNRVQGKRQFREWIGRYQPDACLCLNRFILDWILEMGFKVPEEMGLAYMDLNQETSKIAAGMQQHRGAIGMNAADLLIGKILRGESNVPEFQSGTMVMSHWRPGPTIRPKEPISME